jgi:hypothetical protein
MNHVLSPQLFTVKERVNQMLFEVKKAEKLRATRDHHVAAIEAIDAQLAEINDNVYRIQVSL